MVTGSRGAFPEVGPRRAPFMKAVPGPVIARIPIVSMVPSEISFAPTRSPAWNGAGHAHDAPLIIRHRIDEGTPPEIVRELARDEGGGVYFLDGANELAYAGHIGGGATRQAMRTIRPGHEYAVSYETVDDLNRWEWVWRRAIFMFALASRERGLAAHGSVFLLPDGRAVLCPGVSGTGKSTLAKMLAADDSTGVRVLCDDRAALTSEDRGLWLWSTPWYSRAARAEEGDGPLAAVVLPRRGRDPVLKATAQAEVARELMRTLAFPFWNSALMPAALGMVDAITGSVPAFEFSYAPSPAAGHFLVKELASILSGVSPRLGNALHSSRRE